MIPEVWNGHNVADYVDPDILEKLEELEREEEAREKAGVYDSDMEDDDEETKEIHELAEKIREKKKLMKNERRMNNTKKPVVPRTAEPKKRERSVSRLKKEFEDLGVDMTGTEEAGFAKAGGKRRSTSLSR